MNDYLTALQEILSDRHTYLQLAVVISTLLFSMFLATVLRRTFGLIHIKPIEATVNAIPLTSYQLGSLLTPLLSLLVLRITSALIPRLEEENWLIVAAITVILLYTYFKAVGMLVSNPLAAKVLLGLGIPLLILQAVGALPYLTSELQAIGFRVGNINITLLGVLRVTIFGSLVFWLGKISSSSGQNVIRRQEKLDIRTREVAAKLFEIGVFVVVALILLQIMGINLTALAVFGGALGVGLGFGLQSIASNFISGLIILLDRSLSIGDFIELEDGRSGYVTALNMRSTTLETFEGKDIMVPNEVFITGTFVNWTHKNEKQRYRVDFSVAYDTDIRKLVEVIKEAVASHPQVLSGEDYPIEERPDCEIDSFGDSGVNMFVEFWMEAIDDGKNRVGGDLLLTIYETMREHGFTIPFPQREVRILNENFVGLK